MSTVFEVLCQSLEIKENLKLSSIVVAFDQVLYSRVPGDRVRFSIESTGRTEIQPCCSPTQACIRGSDETGVVRIPDMDSGEAQWEEVLGRRHVIKSSKVAQQRLQSRVPAEILRKFFFQSCGAV